MSNLKTKPNSNSVSEFLKKVESPAKREDSFEIIRILKEITKEEPVMWGDSIVGFGSYHYKYESGREGDWFLTGFSPRKQNLTLYIMSGFDNHKTLLNKLGKYKIGKSCLYINKLKDIDKSVLRELILDSIKSIKQLSKL
ncbi:MAG: DUF1801 domain-containing protein [Candidatus Hermodarchaeota archaeon]